VKKGPRSECIPNGWSLTTFPCRLTGEGSRSCDRRRGKKPDRSGGSRSPEMEGGASMGRKKEKEQSGGEGNLNISHPFFGEAESHPFWVKEEKKPGEG